MHNNGPNIIRILAFLLIFIFVPITNLDAANEGEDLYLGHCAKCHGREGEGFLKLYPPIRNSRYLKEDVAKLPCIIKYGLKGEIEVDGVIFNQIMPAIQQLQAQQIELIICSLQNGWSHPITPLKVPKWLEECTN